MFATVVIIHLRITCDANFVLGLVMLRQSFGYVLDKWA